jgi:demethylmenaquinone methyltransferase/2-methoxy-6-polyprenyl-1,4-benzoquinol methylase
MNDRKNDLGGEASDMDTYIRSLEVSNPLIKPIIHQAIQALQLPLGSRGLDAGCGIGLQALLLAEAVGHTGHVTGLDLSQELLVHGEEIVKQAGLSDRISFREGDVRKLPFKNNAFDWAWSANCIGYAPLEPLPLVKELARVVKPGGIVAILAWSSEKILPGYPLLEARLNATSSGIAPFVRGKNPELHFSRALGWFHDTGLAEPSAKTFAGDAYAPLSDDIRNALIALFKMRWPGAESELTPEDRTEYERLCLPKSPDFILNQPDYYAFFTYTMFHGRVIR